MTHQIHSHAGRFRLDHDDMASSQRRVFPISCPSVRLIWEYHRVYQAEAPVYAALHGGIFGNECAIG